MLGICAASRWELRPVLRALHGVRRADIDGVRAWSALHTSGPLLVFRTGIGTDAASRAAQTVIARAPLTTLVNTGVAGGLVKELRIGHLVIPDLLISAQTSPVERYPMDADWSAKLWAVAAGAGLQIDRGPMVTWPTILSSAVHKRRAAEQFGATAVEMEGGALAAIAARHAIRFACVRSVLDDADTHLPSLTRPPPEARAAEVEPRESVRAIEKISSFLTLAGSFREAFRVLDRFFRAFAHA